MNKFVNDSQKSDIAHLKKWFIWKTEWPTWLLIIFFYMACYFTLTHFEHLGSLISSILLLLFITFYMSLQHELLHGHPTRYDELNRLFGLLPFALLYPFDLYKQQHLIHHSDEHLTDPILDPESNYIFVENWQALNLLQKWQFQLNRNLLGRFLAGPFFSFISVLKQIFLDFYQLKLRAILMWIEHFILIAVLFWALKSIFHVPISLYIIIAYFSISIALIRSFYEHRPAVNISDRTVINEAEFIFRILFLDNNYHLIHHDLPHAPWFMLKTIFKRHQQDYLIKNNGFYVRGYRTLFRLHSIKAIDSPIYQHSLEQVQSKINQRK